MTLLDQVIDGATDDSVSTANLLRKFLVLGSRLKSPEITEWASGELNGLGQTRLADYPVYRGPLRVGVHVTFNGYGMTVVHPLTAEAVPDEGGFRLTNFNHYFNQPIAELEALANAEGDHTAPWPTSTLSKFQKWNEEGRTIQVEDLGVLSVVKNIPRTMIYGVIDNIRTKAMELALEIQARYPEAGEHDGPTFDDPTVRNNVTYTVNNHLYGNNNNVGVGENVTQDQTTTIASGENVTQTVNISKGDTAGLMEFMAAKGLDASGQEALAAAITNDGSTPGEGIGEFLSKITKGIFKFGGEVASPALIALAKVGIGGFFGVPLG